MSLIAKNSRPTEASIADTGTRALLDDVRSFVRTYVVLSDAQADAVALWVIHTHAIAAAETTPYLEISSPEKESGKTRLLETLELLVARAWLTGRTSISALARKVDAELPTLLLDESDAALGGDKTYVQELRGILNSGFRRGAKYTINVPNPQNGWTPRDFSVFCAKAIAGIGSLPDTVVSRSITIRLQRKRPDEIVEKLRMRRIRAAAEPLRGRLETALPNAIETLVRITEAEPAMPDGLSDRAEDVWEPLLAIADLAGGDWPERARNAAVELSGKRSDDENSHRVRLLSDIQSIFAEGQIDEIASVELVLALNAIEVSPWAGWARGKGLTTHSLAKQLKQFEIAPHHTRDGSARGYARTQFDDLFARYLPAQTVKPSDPAGELPAANRPNRKGGAGSGTPDELPIPAANAVSDTLTIAPACAVPIDHIGATRRLGNRLDWPHPPQSGELGLLRDCEYLVAAGHANWVDDPSVAEQHRTPPFGEETDGLNEEKAWSPKDAG